MRGTSGGPLDTAYSPSVTEAGWVFEETDNAALRNGEMGRIRRILCGRAGQEQREPCAPSLHAVDFDIAAVRRGDVLDDAEAEAGAAERTRARPVDAVKPFEDSGQVLRGDADPCVRDGNRHHAVAGFAVDADGAAVLSVL